MATMPLRVDCVLDPGDVARWVGGTWRGGVPRAITGVCLDSREARPGDLFFALPGRSVDGHQFLAQAAAKGAAGVVVSRADVEVFVPCLLVEHTLPALQALAAAHRMRWEGRVAALTSSVGKTTVKDMVASILSTLGPTASTPGSFNNATGVPLTLLGITAHHRYAVVEIGMSRAGEIAQLVPMVKPHVAAVLNVKPVHLEFFPSLEAIAAAKAEILSGLSPGGVAVLNADDPLVRAMTPPPGTRVLWYGTREGCHVRLLPGGQVELDGQEVHLEWEGNPLTVTIPVLGAHHRMNAAGAAAMAMAMGAGPHHVRHGLACFSPSPLRSHLRRLGDGSLLLEDCYNASPEAVKAALLTLRDLPVAGRRVAVLGDMRELGAQAEEFHREVGAYAAAMGVEYLLAIGPLTQPLAEAFRSAAPHAQALHFSSLEDLIATLLSTHHPDDVVLVKGSRAMGLERVCEALVERWGLAPPPARRRGLPGGGDGSPA